jgi:hypothetical protein
MAMLSVLVPINVPAMSDAKDEHNQLVIVNHIDDPVHARADPVEIVLPFELDRASRPRIEDKLIDARGNPLLHGS